MKKLSLLAGMALLSTTTFAQTELGRSLWTGSASVGGVASNGSLPVGSNAYSPSVAVSFQRGAFVRDNWLVGGGVSGSFNRIRSLNNPNVFVRNIATTMVGVDGFVRRYWGKDKWRVFVGGGLSVDMDTATEKDEGSYPNNKSRSTVFNIQPFTQTGASYFLTDRIGLEVAATSNTFPFSVNTFNLSLVLLNGENKRINDDIVEASQTAKGRWVIAGSFNVNNSKGRYLNEPDYISSVLNLSLSPSIGVFISKNTLIGLSIPFSHIRYKPNNAYSATQFGVTPYLKRYISDNRLRPFINGNVAFSRMWSNISNSNTKSVLTHSLGVNVGTGLAYMLGDRFILEAMLGELSVGHAVLYPESTNYRTWNFNLSTTLSPGFNLVYVFR